MFKNKKYIAFIGKHVLSNPGAGAWQSMIYDISQDSNQKTVNYNNFLSHTTHNYLELEAIVVTIESTPKNADLFIVHESSYVDKIINNWIFIWEANGFKTSSQKPIINSELVQRLSKVRKRNGLEFYFAVNGDKPVYSTISNHIAKLLLYQKINKIDPALMLTRLRESKEELPNQ